MSYSIKYSNYLPAIETCIKDRAPSRLLLSQYVTDLHAALDKLNNPVFHVLDLREWQSVNLDELLPGGTQTELTGTHHPMVAAVLLVSNDPHLKSTVEVLRRNGHENLYTFFSPEAAMSFVASARNQV